jgi:NADPH:quinone reductase-like Zn-dependent oxidoreductase
MVLGTPTVARLEAVADLAARGRLTFMIGRTAPLEASIALITDQEQGKRARGKAVIVVA